MSEHDMDFVVDTFPSELDAFSLSLDPTWIHPALNACHKASIHRHRLPAEQAVWLILMIGRLRQGEAPLRYLFHACNEAWLPAAPDHSLADAPKKQAPLPGY